MRMRGGSDVRMGTGTFTNHWVAKCVGLMHRPMSTVHCSLFSDGAWPMADTRCWNIARRTQTWDEGRQCRLTAGVPHGVGVKVVHAHRASQNAQRYSVETAVPSCQRWRCARARRDANCGCSTRGRGGSGSDAHCSPPTAQRQGPPDDRRTMHDAGQPKRECCPEDSNLRRRKADTVG